MILEHSGFALLEASDRQTGIRKWFTAHSLVSDRARAEEARCGGYLAKKPIDPRHVLEAVRRLLRHTGPTSV